MMEDKTVKSGGTPINPVMLCLAAALVFISANCFFAVRLRPALIPAFAAAYIAALLLPLCGRSRIEGRRLKILSRGVGFLVVFIISAAASVILYAAAAFSLFPEQWKLWLISAAICVCLEAIFFWIGIICVYCTSVQLGIKIRVLGIIFGMIPVAHLIALGKIIGVTASEVGFETARQQLDAGRKSDRICLTRYPILMVHGVFFRDYKYLNYWGRIPGALEKNGAKIYYGAHQSASSVEDSAAELSERIRKITDETGCEKVNIIAHSKGGLDCRLALCNALTASRVASLTTINTPHRGCKFADYLLNNIPEAVKNKIAASYNAALRKMGDSNPDFMAAVTDLTSERCAGRDEKMPAPDGVYCLSVGSKLNRAGSGKFPLNFSYRLVKHFDGANDGLVGEESFRWGGDYTFLTIKGKRGISHGDMIDLNRENIPGFDVREFYVQLVAGLKNRGL